MQICSSDLQLQHHRFGIHSLHNILQKAYSEVDYTNIHVSVHSQEWAQLFYTISALFPSARILIVREAHDGNKQLQLFLEELQNYRHCSITLYAWNWYRQAMKQIWIWIQLYACDVQRSQGAKARLHICTWEDTADRPDSHVLYETYVTMFHTLWCKIFWIVHVCLVIHFRWWLHSFNWCVKALRLASSPLIPILVLWTSALVAKCHKYVWLLSSIWSTIKSICTITDIRLMFILSSRVKAFLIRQILRFFTQSASLSPFSLVDMPFGLLLWRAETP